MIADAANELSSVAVKVGGAELSPEEYGSLLNVSVAEYAQGPATFSLRFLAWNNNALNFGVAEGDKFKIGAAVEIAFAQKNKSTTLFMGEVTGLDMTFGAGEIPSLTVHGMNKLHRMQRGTNQAEFEKTKSAEIADKMAKKHGIHSKIKATSEQQLHITQDHKSDLQLLNERANLIGYRVFMTGDTFHFCPRDLGGEPVLMLNAAEDLLNFSAHSQASNQVDVVRVIGRKRHTSTEVIVSKEDAADLALLGKSSGSDLAKSAFGSAELTIVSGQVESEDAAKALAKAYLELLSLSFVTASGECFGRTDLRVGIVIELKGVGPFSGRYYVEQASHTYDPTRGYRTTFSLKRNAM